MQIAALILGILGFLISFSSFADLSLILSILGIVLGIIALRKSDTGKAMCIIAIILSVLGLFICFSDDSGNTNTQSSSNSSQNTQQTLKVGDTWTVDGQWNLTIHSIKPTSDRNPYSEKNPAQVLLVTYSYENLGYYNDFYDEDMLYFSLEPGGDATVIDSNGELAYTYPADQTGYAQETPTGAKCVNAQNVIAVNNVSNTITMNISKYDGNGKKQNVKYILDVK